MDPRATEPRPDPRVEPRHPVHAAAAPRRVLALAALAGRGLLAGNLALTIAQGALPLLGLLAMQQLLDAVAAGIGVGATTGTGTGATEDAFAAVASAVLFAAGVAAAGSLVRAVGAAVADAHARRTADAVAARLLERSARLDLQQLEDPAVTDRLFRAGQESGRAVRVVHDLAGLVLAAVLLGTLGGALFSVAPWLPFAVVLAAAPQAVVRLRAARRQAVWQDENAAAQREAAYLAGLAGGRAAAKDLRMQDAARGLAADVRRRREALTAGQLALSRRRLAGEAATELVASAAIFLVYLFLARQALAGELTIGMLLLQAQAVQRTQNGCRDGLLALSALREHRLFLEHVFWFLALRPTLASPAVPLPIPASPAETLRCAGVAFGYPGAPGPVLRGVDLTLQRGERVALLGRNGSGKSTLVRLLCRLCDPDDGTVRFGGVDVRSFDPAAYRARLSVLFQDAAGFELRVRDNLGLGGATASDDELWAALDAVGLGERVRALPGGLDARLGRTFAGGVQPSVGEWRRLALARALLGAGDVLILDEPFAFLDAAAQQGLIDALRELPRSRTLLLVEHRPEALLVVDRALRLQDGALVEEPLPARPDRPGERGDAPADRTFRSR